MKQKPPLVEGLRIGDRVKLIPEDPTWKAEPSLQGKIAEVVKRRDDGRITVRYENGGLLMGRAAGTFERIVALGLKVKK